MKVQLNTLCVTSLGLLCFFIAFSTSCKFAETKQASNSNHKGLSTTANENIVDTILLIKDTTYNIGNYKLTFEKIDSISIPEIYSDAKDRKLILAEYDNFYAGAKAVESYLKKSQGQYFARKADTLFLKLENGNHLSVENRNLGGDDIELYTYESYFPQLNAYLI